MPPTTHERRLKFVELYWFAAAGPCVVLVCACAAYWRCRFLDLSAKLTTDATELVLVSDYKAATNSAAHGAVVLPASMCVRQGSACLLPQSPASLSGSLYLRPLALFF